MKRKFLIIVFALVSVMACIFGLAGCGGCNDTPKVDNIKLSFIVDGSVYATVDTTGNESITMPNDPQKDGYVFDGWYWDNNIWNKPFTANSLLNEPITSNKSIYAKFSSNAEKPFSLYFIVNGVTYFTVKTSSSEVITLPSSPNKEGYIFDGWYYDNNIWNKPFTASSLQSNPIDSNLTIYAKFSLKDATKGYTIRFIVDGSTYSSINSKGNELINLPEDPAKANFTFEGWYLDKDIWNEEFTSNYFLSDSITADVSVYAKFSANAGVTTYTLSFIVDGVTYTAIETVGNCAITIPDDPAKDGFTFDGWYWDNNVWAEPLTINSLISSPINQDMSVYAKFSKVSSAKYTLSFVVDGTTYHTIQTLGNETVTLPAIPQKNGYVFIGWYWDKDVWTYEFTKDSLANQALTANTSIYAYFVSENAPNGSIGLSYTISENGYIVSGIGTCVDDNITIPSTYKDVPVVGIANSAFNGCFRITRIVVSDGVEYIGEKAFANCVNLIYVSIPDSVITLGKDFLDNTAIINDSSLMDNGVLYINSHLILAKSNLVGNYEIKEGTKSIASYAFNNCELLESVIMSDTVLSIGNNAFNNCTGLKQIELSKNLKNIGSYAFAYCENLKTINIPDGVETISSYAFTGCSSLTNVVIPNSVNSIESSAFNNCNNIEYEIVNENLKYLGDWLFGVVDSNVTAVILKSSTKGLYYNALRNCSELTSITLPNSIISLGEYALYGCSKLTNVVLPNKLVSIGRYAFGRCTSLSSITIPQSVKNIGNDAFDNCDGITAVYYTGDLAAWCNIIFGYNDANPLRNGAALYIEGVIVNELTIPSGITNINDYAFTGCTSITSIVLPNSVQTIGENAFAYCYNLTEVVMANGLKVIDSDAFYQCKSLMSITIPSTVESIGYSAFEYCEKLLIVRNYSDLDIVAGTSDYGYVGYYAEHIYNVANIDDELLINQGDFVFYINDENKFYLVSYNGQGDVVTLPDSINGQSYSIYSNAFSGCLNVKNIIVPDTVDEIMEGAFAGCSNLESITLPFVGKSLKDINQPYQYPFGYVFGTTSYNNGISTKQYYRGSNGTSTTYDYYYIPATLKNVTITGEIINYGAFYNCSNIETVNITNAKVIGESIFYYCSKLTNVTLSAGLSKITSSMFYHCGSLNRIVIPDSVIEIENSAFAGCYKLTYVSFGKNVAVIGDWAFEDCTGLVSIELPSKLSIIEDGLFDGCNSLEFVSLPNNIQYINHYAFRDCSSLITLDIPESVINIGNDVFKNTGIYNSENNWDNNALYIGEYLISVKTNIVGEYTINDGVTHISSYAFYNCGELTKVIVPESVTSIGDYAFYGCSTLSIIESDAHINYLGNYAFYGCSTLTGIDILGDIDFIGERAFYNCTSLASITIPASVSNIGSYAFYNCSALVEIYYNAVECTELKSSNYVFYKAGQSGSGIVVTIGQKVKSIPAYLFYPYNNSYAPKIINIEFETNSACANIGKYAFAYCTSVQTVKFPASLTAISDYAFYNCTGLTGIQYENSSVTISDTAFLGCNFEMENTNENYQNGIYNGTILIGYVDETIASLIIREGTTEIAKEALLGYTNLTNLVIPSSLNTIGSKAFHNCANLEKVNYMGTIQEWCEISFASETSNPVYYSKKLYINDTMISRINLSNQITNINSYAFINFRNIEGVYFSGSLTEWCNIVFGNESANPLNCAHNLYINGTLLKELVIPNEVDKVNSYAFIGLKNVENVVVPNTVASIGTAAFKDMEIKSISLPYTDTLTCFNTIPGEQGMWGVYSYYVLPDTLEKMIFTAGAVDKITGGWGSNMSGSYWSSYNNKTLKEIVLTGDVTSIASLSNFAIEKLTIDCKIGSISSYSLPDTITQVHIKDMKLWCESGVGSSGVLQNAGLYLNGALVTNLIIPEGVTNISYGAFKNYSKLTSVTLPDSLVSIGESAFSSCENLKVINISDNIVSIGSGVLSNTSLTKFNILGNIGRWCNVTVSDSVLNGLDLYCNNQIITELIIPDGTTKINRNVFNGCASLTSVTIPNSVEIIGTSAFANCTGVRTLVLGSGLKTIESSAFSGCSSINKVYYIGDINSWSEINIGASASPLQYAASLYCNGDLIKDTLVIPYGTTEISDYAFANNSYITKVIIPDTVRSIGKEAFKNCINLSEIILPNQVRNIGIDAFNNTAFYNNNANWIDDILYVGNVLVKVKTSKSGIVNVRTNTYWIAQDAFKNCSRVTEINFPLSVRYIPSNVFSGCGSLTALTLPYCNVLGEFFGSVSYTGSTKVTTNSYNTNYYIPTALKSITVLGGEIVSNAFYNCSMLTNITLRDSVYSIGSSAFYNCTGITSFTVPTMVKILSYGTFGGCTSLTSITLGKSISSLYSNFYYNCTALSSIYFKGNIEDYCNISFGKAFEATINIYVDGQKLTNVIIPNTVKVISEYAFMNNTALQTVSIPDSVKTIGDYAFANCPNLFNITIGTGVTRIKSHTFNNCTSLKKIEFNTSIETIEVGALYGCYALQELTYGTNDVIGVLFGTASYDNSTAITVSKTTYYIPASLHTVIYNGNELPENAFYNCAMIKKIIVRNNLLSMGSYAFYKCTGLEYLGLPVSVDAFNGYASPFYGCDLLNVYYSGTADQWFASAIALKLTCGYNLYINDNLVTAYSVSNITDSMFANCKSLQTISIAEGVTSIGKQAFANCTGITSITLPRSIATIDENAYYGCNNLSSVYYLGDIADWCKIEFANSASNPLSLSKNLYINNSLVTELVIPDNIEAIGQYAFYNGSFTSVTIGSAVTEIGVSAFGGCSKLTKVYYNAVSYKWLNIMFANQYSNPLNYAHDLYIDDTLVTEIEIPSGATEVGQYVFVYCTKLQKITIPEGIEIIGNYAFYGCSSLSEVIIPSSITIIKDYAFSGCNLLSAVYYNGTVSDWVNIEFSSSSANPLYYGHNLYVNNELVTDVVINGMLNINSYVFYGCTSIKTLEIGEGITDISDNAFYGCTSLTTIKIPKSLISIGNYAFGNCSAITKINYNGEIEDWCAIKFETNTSNPIYYAKNLYINNIAALSGVLEFSENVTAINQYAFENCVDITGVKIRNSEALVYYAAFSGCSGIEFIEFPANSTSTTWGVPENLFGYIFGSSSYAGGVAVSQRYTTNSSDDTRNFRTYYIPQNLKSVKITGGTVRAWMFYGLDMITNITISKDVTSFGADAFYGCVALETVYYQGELVDWFNISFNTESSNPVYNAHNLYINEMLLTEVMVPSSIGTVNANVLTGASCVTSIIVPTTVTSIGKFAFAGTSITTIDIPYGAAYNMGEGVLSRCSKLTSLKCPIVYTYSGSFWADSYRALGYYFGTSEYANSTAITQFYYGVSYNGFSTGMDDVRETYYFPNTLSNITIGGDKVGYGALSNISLSINVTLDGVNRIDYAAFYNCTGMHAISLNEGLSYINNTAFYNCTGLTTLTIPGTTSLSSSGNSSSYDYSGRPTFYGCRNLESIILSDGFASIATECFEGCSNLKSITIPKSTIYIGTDAFKGCEKLERVNYGGSVLEWCLIDFNTYWSYYKKHFPATNPLYYAKNLYINGALLTDLVIPNNIEEIGAYQFCGATCIESVTLSADVKNIGVRAFSECSNIKNVYYEGTVDQWLSIEFGDAYSNPIFYAKNLHIDGKLVTEIVAPESLDKINSFAFYNLKCLTTLTIGDNVTTIGKSAFYNTGLTHVVIGKKVETISDYAFQYCYKLVEIYNKSNLEITTGSSNNGYAGYYAENIYDLSEDESKLYVDNNGFVFYIDEQAELYYLIAYKGVATDIILPDVINGHSYTIYDYAFYGKSNLNSVIIPESVNSIGKAIFSGCNNLSSITLPYIGENIDSTLPLGYLFGTEEYVSCYKVTQSYYKTSSSTSRSSTTYYIPSSLVSVTVTKGDLNYGAFYNCTSIKYINIGGDVTNINSNAFYNTSKLQSISVDTKNSNYMSYNGILYDKAQTNFVCIPSSLMGDIILPDTITSIPSSAFSGRLISGITIGKNVTSIGKYAFQNCAMLVRIAYNAVNVADLESYNYVFYNAGQQSSGIAVVFGEDVTHIPAYLFCPGSSTNAPNISSVIISKNVTSIGKYAFSNCRALEEIQFNATSMDDLSSSNYVFSSAGQDGSGINVIIGNNVTKIPANLFYPYSSSSYTTKIVSVVFEIGSVCESIGAYAFRGISLTSIIIPDSVTTIGSYTFYDCVNLTTVTIGASITNIGAYAFSSCSNLNSVTFKATSGWYVSTSSNATSGTNLAVTNTTNTANYLKSTYKNYYWFRR